MRAPDPTPGIAWWIEHWQVMRELAPCHLHGEQQGLTRITIYLKTDPTRRETRRLCYRCARLWNRIYAVQQGLEQPDGPWREPWSPN